MFYNFCSVHSRCGNMLRKMFEKNGRKKKIFDFPCLRMFWKILTRNVVTKNKSGTRWWKTDAAEGVWLGYERTVEAPDYLANYVDIRTNKSLFVDFESGETMPDIWSVGQPGLNELDEKCTVLEKLVPEIHDYPCYYQLGVVCQLNISQANRLTLEKHRHSATNGSKFVSNSISLSLLLLRQIFDLWAYLLHIKSDFYQYVLFWDLNL